MFNIWFVIVTVLHARRMHNIGQIYHWLAQILISNHRNFYYLENLGRKLKYSVNHWYYLYSEFMTARTLVAYKNRIWKTLPPLLSFLQYLPFRSHMSLSIIVWICLSMSSPVDSRVKCTSWKVILNKNSYIVKWMLLFHNNLISN